VREDIDAAVDGRLEPRQVLRVREHRQSMPVRFRNGRANDRDRHVRDAILLDRSSEDLDAVGAAPPPIADLRNRIRRRVDERHCDVMCLEEVAYVDRRHRPERLADRQDARPTDLTRLDPAPEGTRVVEHRRNVEDRRESPSVQHRVELRVERSGAVGARVEESGREDVDVAVPEPGGDEGCSAVDDASAGRDVRRFARADRGNAAVANHDDGIQDRVRFRRGIDRRTNPRRVVRVYSRGEQAECEQESGRAHDDPRASSDRIGLSGVSLRSSHRVSANQISDSALTAP
jgi:hypothetical protein